MLKVMKKLAASFIKQLKLKRK